MLSLKSTFKTCHMSIKLIALNWNWTFKQFNASPIILRAYLVFSVVITLADILLQVFGRSIIWPKIIPITGWLPSFAYAFGLFFSFAVIFANPLVVQKIKMRSAIIKMLGISVVYGIINYLLLHGNNSQNPYTQISFLQPYWTMVLPAFWIMLLLLPQVTKFCEPKNH